MESAPDFTYIYCASAGNGFAASVMATALPPLGYFYITPIAKVLSTTGAYYGALQGIVRQ